MLKKSLPGLGLIIGGAASGKSEFAENLVISGGSPRVYLATAQALDDEMRARIARHADRRGPEWQLVEAPLDLPAVLGQLTPDRPVLLDCATLWLSNQMMAQAALDKATTELLTALDSCPAPVIVVTNETGQGVVPDNALARAFREAQGRLNIRLAAQAELVVQVIAGLPNVLKGQLP
ncbi:bifunctional adenosylcobinamide kinase/adenosylcobinamide-phosphate guanylyltransferase [Pseudooceanicola aestuarii]|uniref:bifunctional adenosylcobinamide kinase/adenosylcobinamide-phosphate guanylyltransferase n=1 Tax=Pseudooceanicola aestuarii TaxID=2697319 RepID=UPI0013D51D7F|nr:bifunctional adenosylcobinamide kinase/adenosylcobinamide-phosphate guanylyltransferase [Pseudooceanicola aestuarii]